MYYLQYGCGLCAPSTWRNFDASPTLRLQKIPFLGGIAAGAGVGPKWPKNVEYGDISKGLPVSSNSCRAIYCSHILEHLSLYDFRKTLKNTYDYLSEDGIFRLVVPDLKRLAEEYSSSKDSKAAIHFIKHTRMGLKNRPKGIKGLLTSVWGNSHHLWMWDYKAMKLELAKVGFRDVRRAFYGDSSDPKFEDVENKDRWENELGIECIK